MADIRWWRVELSTAGTVLSCNAVERPAHGERLIHYLQATSAEAAGRAALNARSAELLRQRRTEYRAQGLCRCGRRRDGENRWCAICLEKSRVYKANETARKRGEPVLKMDRRTVLQERKATEKAEAVQAAAPSLRLEVLLEVQQAWADLPTNGAFTSWLTRQIEAAGGRRRAG